MDNTFRVCATNTQQRDKAGNDYIIAVNSRRKTTPRAWRQRCCEKVVQK